MNIRRRLHRQFHRYHHQSVLLPGPGVVAADAKVGVVCRCKAGESSAALSPDRCRPPPSSCRWGLRTATARRRLLQVALLPCRLSIRFTPVYSRCRPRPRAPAPGAHVGLGWLRLPSMLVNEMSRHRRRRRHARRSKGRGKREETRSQSRCRCSRCSSRPVMPPSRSAPEEEVGGTTTVVQQQRSVGGGAEHPRPSPPWLPLPAPLNVARPASCCRWRRCPPRCRSCRAPSSSNPGDHPHG